MRNDDTIDVNAMSTPSQLQQDPNSNVEKNYHQYNGRVVLSKHGSLVVGAGDIGYKLLQLHEDIVKTILLSERVILRWKFDLGSKKTDSVLSNNELDIYFSIIKGHCDNDKGIILKRCLNKDECLICHRRIIHGAEGETDHTFAYQRSCIIVWHNTHSWIRPKTIKYTLDVMVC